MGYSNEWYDKYREHLREENVRRRHDEMFDFFERFSNCDFYEPRKVIDLGCATMEYYKYTNCCNYFGIDKEYVENEFASGEADICIAMKGDYTKLDLSAISPFTPNSFISLFSTEIFMGPAEKYWFYEKIFWENPSIQTGMVAGYYYKGSEDYSTYVEDDGFVLMQTTEDQKYYKSSLFQEYRTYIDMPSKMFGPNGVECWKFFRKTPV